MSSLDNNKYPPDGVTLVMQEEIIKIATLRLGHPLSPEIISIIQVNKWSYMGLESIIDTVKSLEVHEIEDYLSGLK